MTELRRVEQVASIFESDESPQPAAPQQPSVVAIPSAPPATPAQPPQVSRLARFFSARRQSPQPQQTPPSTESRALNGHSQETRQSRSRVIAGATVQSPTATGNGLTPQATSQQPQLQPQAQPQSQQQPAQDADRHSELRHLMRRGIVSTMSTGFRAHLENIVSTTGASHFTRPQVAAATPAATFSTGPTTLPPTRTPSSPSVRPADEYYVERLLPLPRVTAFSSSPDTADELVQLVDSQITRRVLSSDFRTRLETLLRNHITNRGLTPVNLSLRPPSRPIPPEPQPRSPARFTATQPASTATMPAPMPRHDATTTWALMQEMSVLRGQMDDMRRAMDASLAMQLEMQRVMAQELAAVFHAVFQQQGRATTPPQTAESTTARASLQRQPQHTPGLGGRCIVCAEHEADMVFVRCGHVCTCVECAHRCKTETTACPVCRAPIEQIIRCYRV